MTTLAERVLELTALSGLHSLGEHMLSITQTGGTVGDVYVGPGLTAEIEQSLEAELGAVLSADIELATLSVDLQQTLSSTIEQEIE